MPVSDERSMITPGQIALLSRSLELGLCDNRLLAGLFKQLARNPEALLPRQLPPFNQTAFFLWKLDRGDLAKSLLFTCLAWYMQHSWDKSEARAIARDLQHMFAKEGRPFTTEQIEEQARNGRFVHVASWRLVRRPSGEAIAMYFGGRSRS